QGLQPVHVARKPGAHGAEAAAARAAVSQDHEARSAVRAPALVQVGTAGLLADGMQLLRAHEVLDRGIARRGIQPDLEPLRLSLRSPRVRHVYAPFPAES